MVKSTHESEIVLARFEDICPDKNIGSMFLEDIEDDVHTAFEIIGYKPKNFQKCVDKAIAKLNRDGKLYQACYHAWRLDDE